MPSKGALSVLDCVNNHAQITPWKPKKKHTSPSPQALHNDRWHCYNTSSAQLEQRVWTTSLGAKVRECYYHGLPLPKCDLLRVSTLMYSTDTSEPRGTEPIPLLSRTCGPPFPELYHSTVKLAKTDSSFFKAHIGVYLEISYSLCHVKILPSLKFQQLFDMNSSNHEKATVKQNVINFWPLAH